MWLPREEFGWKTRGLAGVESEGCGMGIPEVEAGWKEITDPSREENWTASTEGLRDHLWRRVGAGSCAPGLRGMSGGRLSPPWFHKASVPKHLCPGVLHQGR